jgi:hypothetical protein
MKRKTKKIERKPGRGAIKIVCDEWQVDEPFRVFISEEPDVRLFQFPSAGVVFPTGSQMAAWPTLENWTFITDIREETLC